MNPGRKRVRTARSCRTRSRRGMSPPQPCRRCTHRWARLRGPTTRRPPDRRRRRSTRRRRTCGSRVRHRRRRRRHDGAGAVHRHPPEIVATVRGLESPGRCTTASTSAKIGVRMRAASGAARSTAHHFATAYGSRAGGIRARDRDDIELCGMSGQPAQERRADISARSGDDDASWQTGSGCGSHRHRRYRPSVPVSGPIPLRPSPSAHRRSGEYRQRSRGGRGRTTGTSPAGRSGRSGRPR